MIKHNPRDKRRWQDPRSFLNKPAFLAEPVSATSRPPDSQEDPSIPARRSWSHGARLRSGIYSRSTGRGLPRRARGPWGKCIPARNRTHRCRRTAASAAGGSPGRTKPPRPRAARPSSSSRARPRRARSGSGLGSAASSARTRRSASPLSPRRPRLPPSPSRSPWRTSPDFSPGPRGPTCAFSRPDP